MTDLLLSRHDNDRLVTFSSTPGIVKSKLLRMKTNKAHGIDSVSTKMLIELADEISDILSVLFNKSLSTADVPLDWKLAYITVAVIKKGKKSCIASLHGSHMSPALLA